MGSNAGALDRAAAQHACTRFPRYVDIPGIAIARQGHGAERAGTLLSERRNAAGIVRLPLGRHVVGEVDVHEVGAERPVSRAVGTRRPFACAREVPGGEGHVRVRRRVGDGRDADIAELQRPVPVAVPGRTEAHCMAGIGAVVCLLERVANPGRHTIRAGSVALNLDVVGKPLSMAKPGNEQKGRESGSLHCDGQERSVENR